MSSLFLPTAQRGPGSRALRPARRWAAPTVPGEALLYLARCSGHLQDLTSVLFRTGLIFTTAPLGLRRSTSPTCRRPPAPRTRAWRP